MPLNSVQLYIKGQLDGLTLPGQTKPLKAYIMPPTVDKMDGPRAYVWGARVRADRETAPRGAGFKHMPWVVDVYVVHLDSAANANLDQNFPLIIDAVLAQVWATKMPLMIKDPTTNLETQILSIGEQFELEYPPERLPATMRMIWSSARIGLDVKESVQA